MGKREKLKENWIDCNKLIKIMRNTTDRRLLSLSKLIYSIRLLLKARQN